MVEFIELLFITSLWIWGIHGFFQLTGLSFKINEILPEQICKPLFDCPPCMASVHGTLSYYILGLNHTTDVTWIPFIFCLCGLNYIIKEHLYA